MCLFLVIVEIGNLIKGVEKVCLVLFIVSYKIKMLELNIGMLLFSCYVRGISLMIVGEIFLWYVRYILVNFE